LRSGRIRIEASQIRKSGSGAPIFVEERTFRNAKMEHSIWLRFSG